MEDSASSLSAHETTGWKPVVHDRQDACLPTKLPVLGGPPVRFSSSQWQSGKSARISENIQGTELSWSRNGRMPLDVTGDFCTSSSARRTGSASTRCLESLKSQ